MGRKDDTPQAWELADSQPICLASILHHTVINEQLIIGLTHSSNSSAENLLRAASLRVNLRRTVLPDFLFY